MMVCILPFKVRRIEFEKGDQLSLKEIDGVGYEVVHRKETILKIEELQKKPTVLRVFYAIVASKNAEQAIQFFNKEKEGAQCGSYLKANEIERKLPIIEVDCPRINQNQKGKFICGRQTSNVSPIKSGKFGFCVLGNNEFLPNCNALRRILEIDRNQFFPRETIDIDGEQYSIAKIKID